MGALPCCLPSHSLYLAHCWNCVLRLLVCLRQGHALLFRLALNSESSCQNFPSAVITDLCHHDWWGMMRIWEGQNRRWVWHQGGCCVPGLVLKQGPICEVFICLPAPVLDVVMRLHPVLAWDSSCFTRCLMCTSGMRACGVSLASTETVPPTP